MFKETCLALVLGLSPAQASVVNDGFNYGQPYGLGYSLAAIAIVESSAGKHKFNARSLDFGTYQINIKTAIARTGVDSFWGFSSTIAKLMFVDSYSASLAVEELQYWDKQYKGNWNKTWASYNAGWDYWSGKEYSDKVKKTIAIIKPCKVPE